MYHFAHIQLCLTPFAKAFIEAYYYLQWLYKTSKKTLLNILFGVQILLAISFHVINFGIFTSAALKSFFIVFFCMYMCGIVLFMCCSCVGTHTHTHSAEHQDTVTTVNTGGHLGLRSGLYGLRAITATSFWLWQIVCQSLCNPSKLVIYLFGTLLTPSRRIHPAVSPLSLFLSPLSLSLFHLSILLLFSSFPLSPTYSCVSLFHFALSRFLSPCEPLCFSLSLSSPFFFHASHSL